MRHPLTLLLTALLLSAASLLATITPAHAFCGFYVSGGTSDLFSEATQVVLMREGTKTVLSMRNSYKGPAQDFALVIPVPVVLKEEDVKVLKDELFDTVDQLTAPRLVEYWEQDPCYVEEPRYYAKGASGAPKKPSQRSRRDEAPEAEVVIEAQFDVGEYNIVILSAKESTALETWLKQNKYNIPTGGTELLQQYISQGMYFFVAKVDVKKVQFSEEGRAMLSPLRFHYDSKEFQLPVRLGLLNANGPQDLIIHILSREGRYEVANYKNAFIPTNLVVDDSLRKGFGPFYTALFDYALSQSKGAVITEYSWDASTCDPCPGPPLTQQHIMSLGADVMGSASPARRLIRKRASKPTRTQSLGGWTITRLHARYTAAELKEDLIFTLGDAMAGGRGMPRGYPAKLDERGAVKSDSSNQFQGRYVILNPWKEKIACEKPLRGRWGYPPHGSAPVAQSAQNNAFAPRQAFKLRKAIKSKNDPGLERLK